jgi:hypothetical protein
VTINWQKKILDDDWTEIYLLNTIDTL